MSTQIVTVPDIGGAEDVDVIEISVAVGDTVEVEQSLVVLETDKASMEIPSPIAGKVVSIELSEGDTVSEGGSILTLELMGEGGVESSGDASTSNANLASNDASPVERDDVVSEAVASDATESQSKVVTVPDIGGAESVDVIEICVAPGDLIAEGDSLIVLETDKASMEIPAPFAGTVESVQVKEGDQVSQADNILTMTVDVSANVSQSTSAVDVSTVSESPSPRPSVDFSPEREAESNLILDESGLLHEIPQERIAQRINEKMSGRPDSGRPQGTGIYGGDILGKVGVDASKAQEASSKEVYAGPAVRGVAREFGVDLTLVKPTGPRGRILKEDVQNFVKKSLAGGASAQAVVSGSGIPPIPEVDFSKFGDVDVVPMTKMQLVTAANMSRNWLNVPHVTQFDDADITDLEAFRQSIKQESEAKGVKVTPLSFIIKAVVSALKSHPKFNLSLHADGKHFVQKHYYHIGIAVDTPKGLVVPVLKDADKKSLWEISEEIKELSGKARKGVLKPNEMQGGCFTISSLGSIGGTAFTPIVNAPEVGILGVSKADIKPVYDGSNFVPRKMLPLSLSYDHRAVNGVDAGNFLTNIVGLLSDIRRLVL